RMPEEGSLMPVLTGKAREEANAIVARYPSSRSALMPLLYLVQSVEGYVSRDGLREVAEVLGLTTADVEAVATFYSMYRFEPAGRYVLSVCTNVSCALLGARKLYERAREALDADPAEVTAVEGITLHEEECLGACEQAPVVQVNYRNYARMTAERLDELVESLRGGEPLPPEGETAVPGDLRETSRSLAGLGASE
ncbi:MAG: NAD(P)H-dependent oxidoreductase subunit E, partial [Actinomycetota bacterium]|nr:NAD(P)H-dependent oxidoreductase subunit E [Actinomycetota bacterium]